MTIYNANLTRFGTIPDLALNVTHQNHISSDSFNYHSEGGRISEMGRAIGAGAVTRSGTFADAMLGALDQVSGLQNFASELNQAALLDPDSVDVHDITVAQAQARLSLDITRNVLNRLVQSWRDVINTR